MSESVQTKAPLLMALALVVAGVLVAVLVGGTAASVIGGIVAATGAIPALYAAWKGMQSDTQGGLAVALGLTITALAVAAILVVVGLVGWLRT